MNKQLFQINENYGEKYGFSYPEDAVYKTSKGLSEEVVRCISNIKNEPAWMLEKRLRGLQWFERKPLPTWGGDLTGIKFNEITYYLKPSEKNQRKWKDVPANIKKTFDKLGIPEAERKFLGGVGAQYESETVYHKLKKELKDQGIVFLGMDDAVKQYPEMVRKYFGTIVPASDNKFAALNTATWSGGSFIYVPKNVKVTVPLQAYFRINTKNFGQFERTLIIADEGSEVTYVEGCFTKGTKITTKDGQKLIEEIQEGDSVLTHNNKFRKVYWTQVRPHSGQLHAIQCWGDSITKLEVTGEHPFYAAKRKQMEYKNKKFEPQWIPAKQLKKFDYLCEIIDRREDSKEYRTFTVPFRKQTEQIILKTDADFMRLVGYYLAEGTTISDHYVTFTFNSKEREYIDDVKRLITTYLGKAPLEYPEYNSGISLVLCATKSARLLKQLFGNHAAEKHLPNWILFETPAKQKELIKGFWRGDGSYINTRFKCGLKNNFRMNTVSEILARQLRKMLLRQNIAAGINKWKKKGNRLDSNVLHIGGQYIEKFAELLNQHEVNINKGSYMHKQIISSGRVSYAQIEGDYLFLPIRTIESKAVEDLPVYNFGVEKDESYIANGFAVHNCSAPIYSTDSLHAAVVELVALKNAKLRYTTIQNWSPNVYNLVTKRAHAYENAVVEWVDFNIGSKLTMKYPAVYLLGKKSKADILSIAFAGKNQHQDAGGKAFHLAPETTSRIISKSISKDNGRTSYRGMVKVAKGALNATSSVKCDALLLNEEARSDTYPTMQIDEEDTTISHEAYVGKIGEEQLLYLRSRGLSENEATSLIVLGFMADVTKELPMEYAIELNNLIKLEMEGSVG